MIKLFIISSESNKARNITKYFYNQFEIIHFELADILITGGDGEILHSIHKYTKLDKLFYVVNGENIVFLMNKFNTNKFVEDIFYASPISLNPLKIKAIFKNNQAIKKLAINKVSVFRKFNQAIKLNIANKIQYMPKFIADGMIFATTAGSSAYYNLSAGAPIIPLNSKMLCSTPICSFRPRRRQGAILPDSSKNEFNILEIDKRPAIVVSDFYKYNNIKSVLIKSVKNIRTKLLFDRKQNYNDRIIREQLIVD